MKTLLLKSSIIYVATEITTDAKKTPKLEVIFVPPQLYRKLSLDCLYESLEFSGKAV